jgi:predicted phosphoribosyltransferase
MHFQDRRDAGRQLARELSAYQNRNDAIVLALPRGGVPVAYEVALALNLPLDVFVVRKLGVPGQEELAMGAIASGGARVLNGEVVALLSNPEKTIEEVSTRELAELERREFTYRGSRQPLELAGATVILVDDGLATGATMRAAVAAIRHHQARWIVAGIPVGAASSCAILREEVDELVAVHEPEYFHAVGQFYTDFGQTSDDEVRKLLARAHQELGV